MMIIKYVVIDEIICNCKSQFLLYKTKVFSTASGVACGLNGWKFTPFLNFFFTLSKISVYSDEHW